MTYFLRSRAVRSLPCSVKAHVGMEPHAKTQPSPVLSPEVTATQALELGLLGWFSARTHVSDTEFVVEPLSTPQSQALNQNPSIVWCSSFIIAKCLISIIQTH